MNAKGFAIVNDSDKIIDIAASERKAEAMAGQIGASFRRVEFQVDSRVSFSFHGHPRVGVVVAGEGSHVEVRFNQASSGQIVRRMSVEKVMPA